ncbi:MAG: thermonuclease family protein [Clostridiales bacterium]|nr:thermonuclease family protein [Clostridiales bacterium]
MKKIKTLLLSILAVVVFALCVACGGDDGNTTTKPGNTGNPPGGTQQIEAVDYASKLKLDLTSNTKKQEVTVRLYVDGDTTHFTPVLNSTLATNPSSDFTGSDGYIKARYIAINTPESTGKIEQWGGKASKFTRGRLEKATSIIVESDDTQWNLDGNGRYILWVWYKTADSDEYKNLNVEILQEGLALGSSVANNRYGESAMNAMVQAQKLKLYLYSGQKDPDFPGDAVKVTMKELRCNIEDYVGKRVKVAGLITSEYDNCVYVENVDAETGIHYGIQVFYAYDTAVLSILKTGNCVSVVGVVMYYEAGSTYQISDIKYSRFHPEDPDNSQLIEEDDEDYVSYPMFTEVSAHDIVSGKLTVELEQAKVDEDGNVVKDEDGEVVTEIVNREFDYGFVVWHTSVTVKNLTVIDAYTTKTGNSKGAISLTCRAEDGTIITVRTTVLTNEDGEVIEESKYYDRTTKIGKTITVKGIVDYYKQEGHTEGNYQVKVYHVDLIEILD